LFAQSSIVVTVPSVSQISTTAPATIGGDLTTNGAVNADNAGVLSGTAGACTMVGMCGYGTGTGYCTVTFTNGGASTQGTAQLAVASGGVTNSTLASMTAGVGYTMPPSQAALSGQPGGTGPNCYGTIYVTTVLTPACLHMQDGQGNDLGFCAPPNRRKPYPSEREHIL